MAQKTVINSPNAPLAAGPYSHAIVANGMVFTSGQVGLIPATRTMVEGGIHEQTHQVLKNLTAVLAEAGCTLADVVKTTVFLKNMANFTTMNEIYGTYFPENPPARSTVEVARLPLEALIEIECIAVVNP
jgi:2-iminobutanoate/2-iminopropanoate deaminase